MDNSAINNFDAELQPANGDQGLKHLSTSGAVDLAPLGLDAPLVLSKRETEVLKLVAQGHSNNQIAKMLVISAGTVNNHLTSIYSKFGVNSRTAAIRYALDRNLL